MQPGPLWWAIAPQTARRRGLPDPLPDVADKKHPRLANLELPIHPVIVTVMERRCSLTSSTRPSPTCRTTFSRCSTRVGSM